VASAWIERRRTPSGQPRYRVRFTLGGAGSRGRYAGTFKTRREADARRLWVAGELAAMRVPDLQLISAEQPTARPVGAAGDLWFESRIDVAEATKVRNGLELDRIRRLLGSIPVDALTPEQVATFVTDLAAESYARGTIRKTLQTLAMILDRERISPNPCRDKQVRLPREEAEELNPPTAEHVEAVYGLLPARHRLPFLFLDWSGARVGSIDHVLVSDYDEPRQRVRLRKATTKSRRALWVELHPALAKAIEAGLPHRKFRDPEARLFPESGADALRTAIAKACRAAAVPLFSPHDLRHRRISLLHLRGEPWARIGEFVGQRSLSVTADTYTHVLSDETELDYEALLRAA
jgi:integrase